MDKYGLLGYPLKHSFSRQFFTEKFQNEGIDAQYINFEIPEIGQLTDILGHEPDLKGLNVTIPYKEQVIPFLDEISAEAKAIGAVNVIRITRNRGKLYLKGFNSDIIGFQESIKPLLEAHHRKALILGTGGASKAVKTGLEQLGIDTCYVSRSAGPDRITYDQLDKQIMEEHLVVVNCSPCGMFPHNEECPDIPYQLLTPRHLLYDLVYNPLETEFMKRGMQQGAKVKNGLEMLHLQAVAGWNFWNSHE